MEGQLLHKVYYLIRCLDQDFEVYPRLLELRNGYVLLALYLLTVLLHLAVSLTLLLALALSLSLPVSLPLQIALSLLSFSF